MLLRGSSRDADDRLAVQALAVHLPLAGKDHVSARKQLVKPDALEDGLNAGLELAAQKCDDACAECARSASTRHVCNICPGFLLHEISEMDEIPVQKRDHFFIRALLGRKDCRRALRAVHRVVDVAHGSDGAAGKKALEAGESELAAGAKELADGAAQLEAGRNDLEAFESGMALVDEYTMVCFKNEPIYRHNGDMAVPGPEQRLGSDFDWKKYDENGNLMTLRTGEPYLDLDQCLVVCKSFRESVDHHVADVTHELYMRLGLYVALAVAAVLGIIGGILGLVGKKGAFVLGIITAVLAVGCNIFGLLTRYHGYTYPLKDGTYSGTLQIIAIITFALVALGFLIVTAAAKNEAAKQAAEA